VDKAARAAIVRIIAAMDDKEFADLTAEARGDTWTPGPADYRNSVAELEGETLMLVEQHRLKRNLRSSEHMFEGGVKA
jgi:hypothetical protein